MKVLRKQKIQPRNRFKSKKKKLYWRTYNETNKTIRGKDQLRNPVKWKDKKATNVSEGDAGKPLIL